MQKQPNRFIAPIVIAGITVGFLVSAYKFVFAKNKVTQTEKTGVDETPSIEANQIDAAP
ncbi:hypothetical protein N5J48_07910 [Acinetobacter ursingii]|jgi:hypothetical protein|uniref:Uncharacterized protein n=3 Tax=Acinetobacter TaxID=469 RepID=N9D7K3_9GAMM|nr:MULTISPECIES: hypothetical protein [Acinetobacter]ENV77201.1 hypothetical protein F944_00579 [Acinetobacter ursingii DSM 16037 = CIP 107286]ENV78604.1 hypothetical protein F942_02941 [Acinetobacter ursingii ANC 3649]MCU4350784.1 hypothetical protein [Acinetobacter ursingii]MCU4481119.1 hypothetical protein [Acinetobacter ursingii]MCU4496650.1 hypothetical protein [Acinetobacter ursingii]